MQLRTLVFALFVAFLLSLYFTGCVFGQGLQRTSFEKWHRIKFDTLGIEVEIPSDNIKISVFDSSTYVKNAKSKAVYFELHPFSKYGMDEKLYLLNVDLIILERDNYNLFKSGSHKSISYKKFLYDESYEKISEYEVMHPNGRTPLRCFRKDMINGQSGEVVLAAITYFDNFQDNTDYRDKDIESIKRILNSIEFLDGGQK